MSGDTLDGFIAAGRRIAGKSPEPADCALAIAPLMLKLLRGNRASLKPQHFRPDPDRYARNAVYVAADGGLSLFALVWEPGQWTPVHDHGTWGVVGVVRGVLEKRA